MLSDQRTVSRNQENIILELQQQLSDVRMQLAFVKTRSVLAAGNVVLTCSQPLARHLHACDVITLISLCGYLFPHRDSRKKHRVAGAMLAEGT
jgi:hypothetical protein